MRLLAALVLIAPAAFVDALEPARPRARVEVSKAVAGLLTIKCGKVFVKGGHEITLLRGFDVELKADDVDLRAKPDPALALYLRLKLIEEVPARNALAGPGEQDAFLPHSTFEYQLHFPGAREDAFGQFGAGIEGSSRCPTTPTNADWEAARLDALAKLDGLMRDQVSGELPQLAREVLGEKPGWYLENPFPFVIEGQEVLAGSGKCRKQVPFRLSSGRERVRIGSDPFVVRDLVLSPLEPKK